MKKYLRTLILSFISLLGVLLIVMHVLFSYMHYDDDATLNAVPGYEIDYVDFDHHQVRVVEEEDEDSTLIIFIHGAPGSWDAFKDYLNDEELKKRGKLIAIDRPGYGASSHIPMRSIMDHAKVVESIANRHSHNKLILVGHSYGGPIAGYMASKGDSSVVAAIMIAPLIDPDSEPIFWYSYPSYWKATRWLLPSGFQVAGSEKFAHANALKQIEDSWKNAKVPIVHIHGLKDGLAPAEPNIQFARMNIPDSSLQEHYYDDEGHLIIWENMEEVKKILINVIDKARS